MLRRLEQRHSELVEGRNHDFEYRMIKADGSVVWLRDVVTVESDKGGACPTEGYDDRHHRPEAGGGGERRFTHSAPPGAEDGSYWNIGWRGCQREAIRS